jgi:hydroxypyruvate isomerase
LVKASGSPQSIRFSANIGFLYDGLPLVDRIRAAARDGFDGVECHWPFDVPGSDVAAVLRETGLPMLGLNTHTGDRTKGLFGLSAVPGLQSEARRAIEQAVDYGALIGARNVHVMAGYTDGGSSAEMTFRDNLRYACDLAADHNMTVLIEPLNSKDHPNYHLSETDHAAQIISDLDRANLKLMFDCYHVQIAEGHLQSRYKTLRDLIGHVQIASAPDRHEPDDRQINFVRSIRTTQSQQNPVWVGAEYNPRTGRVEDGLSWLPALRREMAGQL